MATHLWISRAPSTVTPMKSLFVRAPKPSLADKYSVWCTELLVISSRRHQDRGRVGSSALLTKHQGLGQPVGICVHDTSVIFYREPQELLEGPSTTPAFFFLSLIFMFPSSRRFHTAVTGGLSCLSTGRAMICISL